MLAPPTCPAPAPTKIDTLNAILTTTTRLLYGDAQRALNQMHAAADSLAETCGVRPDFVRAFVTDQRLNLAFDGKVAS